MGYTTIVPPRTLPELNKAIDVGQLERAAMLHQLHALHKMRGIARTTSDRAHFQEEIDGLRLALDKNRAALLILVKRRESRFCDMGRA